MLFQIIDKIFKDVEVMLLEKFFKHKIKNNFF